MQGCRGGNASNLLAKQGETNMTNYVLVYTGGPGMEQDEATQQQVMADWGAWYEKVGAGIVDGGNPFGASKSVSSEGVSDGPASSPPATGYTVISADSLDEAVAQCQGHPHIKHGGQVSVYETFQVM
jgi:hypothetical protein